VRVCFPGLLLGQFIAALCFQLHVSVAVPVSALPLFALAGRVAVTVTAEFVWFKQVATPKVASWALLMFTLIGSETDQVTFLNAAAVAMVEHPEGMTGKAKNWFAFAGGEALWSALALGGEILIAVEEQSLPPHPASKSRLRNK